MGAPQSTVTYGSFTFPFTTLVTDTDPLYAEDGFTRVGARYFFTITGVIGGVSQGDLQSKIASMQDILRRPRQAFIVSWTGDGSTEFFHYFNEAAPQSGAGQDLDWGPKPGPLQVMRMTGGRSAIYRWTVSVNVMDRVLTSDVLAVTWNFTHSIDPSGYTTRTVSGKILIEGGSVQFGQSADHYRAIVSNAIPALTWYKFEGAEYSQSPDGRVLSFSVTETEQYWTFPTPITNGHVSWMMRVGGYDSGLMVDYVLSGWMESSAKYTKNDLVNTVFTLAAAKFGAIKGTLIPGERVLREDVYGRNRIDFSISAQVPGGGAPDGNIDYTVGLQTFGIQPPGSDGKPIKINPYGQTDELSSGSVAPSPSLYDATSGSLDQSGGYQFVNTQQPPNTIAYVDTNRVPPNPAGQQAITNGISDDHLNNPIVEFHEVISYEFDSHIVVFPSKKLNADPIIQQTAMPTQRIIQCGYMSQIAAKVTDLTTFANPPIYTADTYAIEQSYLSAPNAVPVADGSVNKYTTEWRYIMVGRKNATTDQTAFVLPLDPRRKLANAESIAADKVKQLTVHPDA